MPLSPLSLIYDLCKKPVTETQSAPINNFVVFTGA